MGQRLDLEKKYLWGYQPLIITNNQNSANLNTPTIVGKKIELYAPKYLGQLQEEQMKSGWLRNVKHSWEYSKKLVDLWFIFAYYFDILVLGHRNIQVTALLISSTIRWDKMFWNIKSLWVFFFIALINQLIIWFALLLSYLRNLIFAHVF